MHLVERFSCEWGSEVDSDGKLTWAEVLSGPNRARGPGVRATPLADESGHLRTTRTLIRTANRIEPVHCGPPDTRS